MQHVFKATEEGPVRVKAQVYQLQFDGGKLAVFVEEKTCVMSHYASGQIICGLPMVRLSRERKKPVCQKELDRRVYQLGKDAFREALASAPTINPQ